MKKQKNQNKLTFREVIEQGTYKLQSYGINKLYAYYLFYLDKLEKFLNKEFDNDYKEFFFHSLTEKQSINEIIDFVDKIYQEG